MARTKKNRKRKVPPYTVIAFIVAVVIVAAFLIFSDTGGDKAVQQPSYLSPALQAKDFVDIYDRPAGIHTSKGNVLLINFWSKECPACLRELPHIQKLYEKYYGDEVEIITFNLDRISTARLKHFMEEHDYRFPVVHTSAGYVVEHANISATPTTDVVGRDGEAIERIVGAVSFKKLDRLIKGALE
ncbi:TlpA family protein disulfide reductase [Desulfurispira natronophila]|uniref:Thiol-disulfide isomerase/thioredoxin n=1 Tax=Desulfurispira natronophila TaxID=682562 RepID=A0A7W7Y2Z9_9BACT|nr:TlpA disulfide reductase family protein [Desulfurispira natronophila]MBB5021141.1 thiol-disulfide isomerase/thioredoxin [Desulfurispira natronophila]